MNSPNAHTKFSLLYFFIYLGFGAFIPLLSLYLEQIGMNGTQIGTITSIGAFCGVISGPFWGYVSDRSHQHKGIFLMLLAVSAITAGMLTATQHYGILVVIFFFHYIAVTPVNALMDGLTIHTSLDFGRIRLWGSISFAVAALVTGFIAQRTSLLLIFFMLIISFVLGFAILSNIRVNIRHSEPASLNHLYRLVTDPRFVLFLSYNFLVNGTIAGNNNYFGLYFKSIGGNVALVGLAFFLFALSEAPFMSMVNRYIRTHGIYPFLVASPILGMIRWGIYSTTPTPALILGLFFMQGIFYAAFLVSTAEYIRRELPVNLRTTGMAVNAAVGFGLGGAFNNFISGYIYEYYTVGTIYAVYAVLCFLGLLLVPFIYRLRTSNS